MTRTIEIHQGMVETPALPRLREIAAECGGEVCEMRDFSNVWPNRSTNPGDRDRSREYVLVAQGWDGGTLYGVIAVDVSD